MISFSRLLFHCLLSFAVNFAISSLFAVEAEAVCSSNQILYIAQRGDIQEAIKCYNSKYEVEKKHDVDLLQQLGLLLIEQGARSSDPEIVLMTLFGAGISTNEKIIPFLIAAVSHNVPQIQLIALNFLARYQNDEADYALKRGMSSNYPIIRLECSYLLAARDDANAVDHAEALMCKLEEEVQPLFAELYAKVGNKHALRLLKRMMNSKNPIVRISAILNAADCGCEELTGQMRMLASHPEPMQQEACAFALGRLQDSQAVMQLKKISQSESKHAKLAALQSLYQLGHDEVRDDIEALAKQGDVFAIASLQHIEGSADLLFLLCQHANLQVRVNAAISLLKMRDDRCLKPLCDILISDPRDLALVKTFSQGKSLTAFKVVPSAQENFKDNLAAIEMSLHLRENLLVEASKLSLKSFLLLAKSLLEYQQNDLIPTLIGLIEDKKAPQSIELLRHYQQKAGAPLIRMFCQLALFRLGEEGGYKETLENWVQKEMNEEMIRFRPMVADANNDKKMRYQLNPQEKTRLLVETIEAFALRQDESSIKILLKAIAEGNPKNRYALAGLLIRSCQ